MTKIEWCTDSTNPIRACNLETDSRRGHFCVHVSPGCEHCYAETMQPRFRNPVRYAAQDADRVQLFLDTKTLMQPLRWRRRRTIFLCSMSDVCYEGVPDLWIDKLLAVAAMAPQHTFHFLTKRTDRMRRYFTQLKPSWVEGRVGDMLSDRWDRYMGFGAFQPSAEALREGRRRLSSPGGWPLPNLCLGASVEDRARKGRIDELRATPAAVRFLSLEPLLEDLGELDLDGIHWVIVGGESGAKARAMHPDWARSVRDQCAAANVPFFFKQWGSWTWVEDMDFAAAEAQAEETWPGARREMHSCGRTAVRVGKEQAGRLLDGRLHEAFPEAA